MRSRALFLDRDGVVNEEVGYLHRADEVRFVDGIFSLCRTAAALGYRLIVVTNQAGIPRGYYLELGFEVLMEFLPSALRLAGVVLDAVYYCPFNPDHSVREDKSGHEHRKPGRRMI